MSRIDISVTDKATDKLLKNTGFCRSLHLEYFCENSQDTQLQDFAHAVRMTIALTKDNIEDFLQQISYVINFLTNLEASARANYFPFYRETSYTQFIDDLNKSLGLIQTIAQNKSFDHWEVDII